MMKIICDCGNEIDLIETDEETGEQNSITEDEGLYVTFDHQKASLWEQHDVVGIVCKKCHKAVWLFC